MITIIDIGVGNIKAFVNLYKGINQPVKIAKCKEDLNDVKKIILPGVGHFDYAMNQINKSGMRDSLDELVLEKDIPVMGICVGMQIMANKSDEGKLNGLGWINAEVKKMDTKTIKHSTKLPHMGWNNVKFTKDLELFRGIEENPIFYFLHTYYVHCHNDQDIAGFTEYGKNFASAVNYKNRYGVQFHPEKSHCYGETLLYNFAKLLKNA